MLQHIITPKDVYSDAMHAYIRSVVLKEWSVVAFRAVRPGDTYVTNCGNVHDVQGVYIPTGILPQLIVVRKQPAPPIFTEVVIPEHRVTMKDVYGCEVQDVLNQANALGYEVIGFRKPEPGDVSLCWNCYVDGKPSGRIVAVSTDDRSRRPELSALPRYLREKQLLGHCDGIRAIVRRKQGEADPFA